MSSSNRLFDQIDESGHASVMVIQVVGAVFYKDNKILLFRRTKSPALFEFPGGKVEGNETDEQALRREIQEELGVDAKVEEYIAQTQFESQGRKLNLKIYFALPSSWTFDLREHDSLLWLENEHEKTDMIMDADRPLLPKVFRQLKARQS